MTHWEYWTLEAVGSGAFTYEGQAYFGRFVTLEEGAVPLDQALDRIGANGWELVAATASGGADQRQILYFKRPRGGWRPSG